MTRAELPEDLLVFDPAELDDAIIGISADQPGRQSVVVYDYDKLVEIYTRLGMSEADAEEWLQFNTLGAWLGEGTPIILFRTETAVAS